MVHLISFSQATPQTPDIRLKGKDPIYNLQEALTTCPSSFKKEERRILEKLVTMFVVPEPDAILRSNSPRPIWLKSSIWCMFPAAQKRVVQSMLPSVSYSFSEGPWRDSSILYGYDPRADPRAR